MTKYERNQHCMQDIKAEEENSDHEYKDYSQFTLKMLAF